MDTLNRLLDWLFFSFIMPVFNTIGQVLYFMLLKPLILLNIPIWIQICLIAVVTVAFAFWLRRILEMSKKTKKFTQAFTEQRRPQDNFKLIKNIDHRRAMYESSDHELNDTYNSFLAGHYARYVMIYLLPIFLIMEWLNNIYSAEVLISKTGYPFVMNAPKNDSGIEGFSVTFFFLVSYIISLIIGFIIRHRLQRSNANATKKA